MEAEEVQSLASLHQMHDPGLGRFRFMTEVSQDGREGRQRPARPPLGSGTSPPAPTPEGLIEEDLQGIVGRPLRAKPEAARPEVGFEDRLNDDLYRRLHDAVRVAGMDNGRWAGPPGLGIHTRRAGNGRRLSRKLCGQFVEQAGDPVALG